jgi:uncharacterized membrane protein
MALLLTGLFLFLAVHSVRIFADGWRTEMVARMGALPWKAVYALLSIVGFTLLVYGYGLARQQPVLLWSPPAFMRHVTALLMLPVFMLFVATYVPRNWFKSRLRHPQVLSVKLWAVAHLLSNGALADVVLFGAFLAWAVASFSNARKRDRATGAVPQEASAAGTITCVAIGLAIYAAFVFGLHAWMIGVKPV